jgi:uncharacterized protein YpmB
MKRFLIITCFTLIVGLTPIFSMASGNTEGSFDYSPANVIVFVNGKQMAFDQAPVLVENRILVPLRAIAESLGVRVKWARGVPQIKVRKGDTEIGLNLGSDKGFTGDRQLFVMEQPPVLVNGRAMVSLRFMAEALGANVDWDENTRCVYISAGNDLSTYQMVTAKAKGLQEKPGEDTYYKLYDVVVGPDGGPAAEEAKEYVLKEGLLKTITDVQKTFTRFTVFGDANTMVIGNDESGREKAVWLVCNKYTRYISVTGSVFMDEVIPKETIYSKLEEKGISRVSVKKIYLAPYEKDKIFWFTMAEQGQKYYNYCFDYRTGDLVIENVFKMR